MLTKLKMFKILEFLNSFLTLSINIPHCLFFIVRNPQTYGEKERRCRFRRDEECLSLLMRFPASSKIMRSKRSRYDQFLHENQASCLRPSR